MIQDNMATAKRLKLRTQRDRTARADTSPCVFSDRSFSKGRYGFALVHALCPMSVRRLLAGQVANIDSMDVRNLGAAQAKCVACTRLSPFRRVGFCCRRQHQDRKRRQHQTELEIPGPGGNHEAPKATPPIRTLNRAACLQKTPPSSTGLEKTPLDWIMPRFAKPGSA